MGSFLYRCLCVSLLGLLVGWVVYLESVRFQQISEITDAHRIVQQEALNVLATKQAQAQAAPLIAMVTELAAQNTAYIKVVEEARRVVQQRNLEAARDKAAIEQSVELLREASVEHNRNVDYMRKLERFIDKLLKMIPENERPLRPRLDEEDDTPKPKWS
ncbi:MAG: hypothetical protein AMS22_08455 [Thiotrichales bacterium SG8_50]|nr:MAG: hypothetical protein AMS22_08455 [Thiotrichales bacterium SG8_50]